MDPFFTIPLAVMATLSAVGVTAGLLRGHRHRRRRLAHIAEELGLTHQGNHVTGMHDGVRIGLQTHVGGPRRLSYVRLHARFDPPLDLGLCIYQTGTKAPKFGQGKSLFVVDGRFSGSADDPARGAALATPALIEALGPLHGPGNVVVSDSGVTINTPIQAEAPVLIALLRRLLDVAAAVEACRKLVPVASELRGHKASWSAYARENHLAWMSAPLCMHGSVKFAVQADATVHAFAVRVRGGSFELVVRVGFRRSLSLDLSVESKRASHRVREALGRANISFGDADFDTRYAVSASNVAEVRALLTDEVRANLLALQDELGPLALNDDGVKVRLPEVPEVPSRVPAIVTALLGLVRLIEDNRGDEHKGPYR